MQQKTSITAYLVTASLAKLSRMKRWQEFFSEDEMLLYRAFARHSTDTPVKRFMYSWPPHLHICITDFLFIPGIAHHFLFRKRLVERLVRKEIADGAKQVLVLGGGFDTLALRLAKEYPLVVFFEVDLPETQEAKKVILQEIGYPIPSNCIYLNHNLITQSLLETLSHRADYHPAARTVAVLEAVLMYFTENEVQKLLRHITEVTRDKLALVFGATVAADDEAYWQLRLMNYLMGKGNEAAKWFCPSRKMPEFLAALGYELLGWASYKSLQRPYRKESEIRHVLEEDENYYLAQKSDVSVKAKTLEEIPPLVTA